MTSNVGAKLITQKSADFGFTGKENSAEAAMEKEKIREAVMGELKKTFRPEFLNRVDDIIVFDRLQKDDIKKIAVNLLDSLKKRVEELGIGIEFTDKAISDIADAGFDEVYGARPLKRAIQNKIENLLSEEMLENKVVKGKSYICDSEDGKFSFKEKPRSRKSRSPRKKRSKK